MIAEWIFSNEKQLKTMHPNAPKNNSIFPFMLEFLETYSMCSLRGEIINIRKMPPMNPAKWPLWSMQTELKFIMFNLNTMIRKATMRPRVNFIETKSLQCLTRDPKRAPTYPYIPIDAPTSK
jgi:hypothetical protein